MRYDLWWPRVRVGLVLAGRLWALVMVMSMLMPRMVLAQRPPNPAADFFGLSAFVAVPEAVAQYQDPSMCIAAALREEQRADRTVAAQQRMFVALPDTLALAPATVQAAQLCSARWPIAQVSPLELPGLIRLALMANEDEKATAAITRWVQGTSDPFEQATRLVQSLRFETWARPFTAGRLHAMEVLFDSLRTLASTHPQTLAAQEASFGQFLLLQEFNKLGDNALATAYVDTVLDEMTTVLTPEQLDEYGIFWDALLAVFNSGLAGQQAYAFTDPQAGARFATRLERFKKWSNVKRAKSDPGNDDGKQVQQEIDLFKTAKTATDMKVAYNRGIFGSKLGKVSPINSLEGRWFHRPDSTVSYPRPGIPTIMAGIDLSCGDACYPMYAAYKRLYAEFAPKGVDFILSAYGSTGALRVVYLTEAQDVDTTQDYIVNRLKLPGILRVHVKDIRGDLNEFSASLGMVFKDGWTGDMQGFTGKDMLNLGEEMARQMTEIQLVGAPTKGNLR